MRKLLLLFLLSNFPRHSEPRASTVIFFTDLDSGPNSGGESVAGYSGAYDKMLGITLERRKAIRRLR